MFQYLAQVISHRGLRGVAGLGINHLIQTLWKSEGKILLFFFFFFSLCPLSQVITSPASEELLKGSPDSGWLSPVWFPPKEWLPLPFVSRKVQEKLHYHVTQIPQNKPFIPWIQGLRLHVWSGRFGATLHPNPVVFFQTGGFLPWLATSLAPTEMKGDHRRQRWG